MSNYGIYRVELNVEEAPYTTIDEVTLVVQKGTYQFYKKSALVAVYPICSFIVIDMEE